MDLHKAAEDQRFWNSELFRAVEYGRKRSNITEEKIIDKVKECLCKGADIDAINLNNDGNTALHLGIQLNYKKVIGFLLENGPKVDIENRQGLTALALAQQLNCQQEIIDLLENYAKSVTSKLSITYWSKYQNIWSKLKNNSEIAVLEVDSVELSPDFLQQVKFYDAIDTAGNLFFVDVIVSHMDNSDEDFIKSQLNRLSKQSIIQCGSVSNTKVYCIGSEGEVNVINLNVSPEYFDEKSLTDKLSKTEGFNLDFIVDAVKLNLVGAFESERRNLLKVRFDIEKHFNNLNLIDYAIKYGDLLTVRLLSLSNWNLMRLSDWRSTLSLAAELGDVEKLAAVLRVKFPIQHDNNICLHNETAAHFNECKEQMLETAVEAGNCDVIRFLIKCGVELNRDAIELAWDMKRYDVVLMMLRADCVFPGEFELDEIVDDAVSLGELRMFVEERNRLHSIIEEGDLERVGEFMKSIELSRFYLNKDNKSALYRALISKRLNIFVWLKSELKAEFRDDYERRGLGVGVLDSATDALLPHFVPIENAHILHLVAKSRCHRHYEGFKDHIESIYLELNNIPHISIIFKVIQFCDQLDIIYDFDRDSIVDVNVSSSESDKGFCEYKVGRIYIGAKVDKNELLGTIAHELTHEALQIIYDNDCKPYKLGDPLKDLFENVIKEISYTLHSVDSIIRRVFICYGKDCWPSELIVRVNHMLATYGSEDGLRHLEVQATPLLKFYQDYVIPCCETFVSESHLIKPRNIIKVLNEYSGITRKIESKIALKKCVDVREVFSESEVQIAVVTSTSPFLSTMSVYQSLKEISQQPNGFMIFNFDGYVKRRIEINQAFYSDVCKFLVLLGESSPEKSSLCESLKKLAQVLWKKSDKKVIFIMENCELSNEVNELVNLSLKVYPDVEYTLDDVRVESARLLLDQSVSLQCRDANIKLSSLIDEEHYKLVDAHTLLKLINKQPIVIGKQIIMSSNYDQHFYIDRTFSHQAMLKEEILIDKSKYTLYAISDIDKATLANIVVNRKSVCKFHQLKKRPAVKYVIVDSNDGAEQFQQLCQLFPRHNIHWLKKVNDLFQWLESRCVKGDLSRLQAFNSDQSVNQYSEDKLANQEKNRHVVLVSDTAGMGKSTLLTSLAERLIERYPHLWVIRVDLNDYTKVLEEEQEKHSFQKNETGRALNYFADRLLGSRVETKFETEFEKNLLLHFLQQNEDSVVIMFDGFDEIKKTHQNVILNLLAALKSSKVKQLWVTTRPHMRKTLENTVHHLTYTLQPLDETDQVNFLTRFWKRRLNLSVEPDDGSGCSFDTKLQCFAEALIKLLSESISDREKVFTGVPLQLRMVGECFEEDAENICKSDGTQPHLPPKLKLNDLYQNFFNKKYKIFQLEKNNADISKLNWELQNDVLKEYFIENHQIASLFTLFDESERELLLTSDEISRGLSFMNDISNCTMSTGIIDLIIEGKPRFVHLTFAEFLTAEFIVHLLSNEQPNTELIELLWTKVFCEDSFKVVRAFIDSHLGQKIVTDSVLKGHGRILRSVWSEKPKISKLGKFISGLFPHYNKSSSLLQREKICHAFRRAVKEGNANLVNFFLNLGNSNIRAELIKHVDDFQMQALHLAVVSGHLDVVKVLAEHKADLSAPVCRARKKFDSFNALLLSAYFGCADICEWLINNGADINATVSVEGHFVGHNVLHIAALQGKLDVVKVLRNVKGIDINAVIKGSTFFDGINALQGAASNCQWDVVKWIVSEGLIDINITHSVHSYIGKTVLIEAVKKGPLEMVQWLIEHNADVNIGQNVQDTALHFAVSQKKLKVVEMLVGNGAHVNAVNQSKKTPLHYAAANSSEEVVEFLLTVKGVDVNAADIASRTPLHQAAARNKIKIVEILLSNGVNVNAVDCDGQTPLHCAAASGSELIVECLLKNKDVDVNTVDKDGRTPLQLASMKGYKNIQDIIMKFMKNS